MGIIAMEKTIVVGHVIIPQDQRMAIIQETVAQKFVAMPDLGVTVLIEYCCNSCIALYNNVES
jgi:hypothetical protein